MILKGSSQKKLALFALFFGLGLLAGGFLHRLYVYASPYIAKLQQCPPVSTPSLADWTLAAGNDRVIILPTRTYVSAGGGGSYTTERDGAYEYQETVLDLDKTALILMDVWQKHPNNGWTERAHENIEEKIVPLLELARAHQMIIIHAPNEGRIHSAVCPREGEINLTTAGINKTDDFSKFLKARGINTLLYAGYSSNWCLLNRPSGLFWMAYRDYDVILLRDCTIALENAETLDGEWANKVIINMVEMELGKSSTLDDLRTAFGENPANPEP